MDREDLVVAPLSLEFLARAERRVVRGKSSMQRVILTTCSLWLGCLVWAGFIQDEENRSLERPIAVMTPGVVAVADVTTLCNPDYVDGFRRHVGKKLRDQIFHAYGIYDRDRSEFELDRLLPVELGGSPDDPKNLWPQSRVIEPWNAGVKNRLEDVLHKKLCAGEIPLSEAQNAILADWIGAYVKYVGPEPRRFIAYVHRARFGHS
jgi:hypothetical protein